MNSTWNDMKRYLEKLRKEKAPHGIKDNFKYIVDRILYRDLFRENQKIQSIVDEYNANSKCRFLPINSHKYVSYNESRKDGFSVFVFLDIDTYVDSESADITIMLPLIANAEQIESLKKDSLKFWGAHPAVIRSYHPNDLLENLGKVIRSCLNQARYTYNKYESELEQDKNFSFFVMQRLYYLTMNPFYYYRTLSKVLLKMIRDNLDMFHMPGNMRKKYVKPGNDTPQKTDILINRLFNEKLTTTITDIAHLFWDERHQKEAKEFARIALELNDRRAEAILSLQRPENVSHYESEVRHIRDMYP